MISGCASVVSNSTQKIAINTYPDKAKIAITNSEGNIIQQITTPSIVILPKSNGYFNGERYLLNIEKDGYISKTLQINSDINSWYKFGNILFGGLIGWLIIDPLTGSMFELKPNEVNIHLEKRK